MQKVKEVARDLNKIPAFSAVVPSVFKVADKFTEDNPEVKIVKLSKDFIRLFGDKVETSAVNSFTIYGHLLALPIKDIAVFNRLSKIEKAISPLGAVYDLLEQQPCCEEGDLVNGEEANVFYARDIFGKIQAITLHGTNDGWKVLVFSTDDFKPWEIGCKIHLLEPLVSLVSSQAVSRKSSRRLGHVPISAINYA